MNWIAGIGAVTVNRISAFGDFCRFCGQTLSFLYEGLTRWKNLQRLFPQFFIVGTESVPVVMITGAFVGMVLSVQTVMQFKGIGRDDLLGSVLILSVLRELGPVLAGVMLAGRVGGGLTAELGTMRVTEQIDALRAMGADPVRVLVVPRFLACVLLIPVLVMYADFMGVLGGYVVSVFIYGVSSASFFRQAHLLGYFDIFYGPLKSVFFGAVMSLICCYKGFRCRPGAAGVGRACTESFVASSMAILALNFFLGMLLNSIYAFLYGSRQFV
ncbi:MAG TPA: ABC transporter permease [Phycisphaerales bacterium]|nr:ABC transporter permease [Phycisphaerales bacterium]